ncbi:MAG: Cysteine desulfurase [uncultured Nocardioidaceae bacterium]|uniref:cysteine desulfurase n=1 Tax=uncultured Nocardioidaceae bacterium TaxID=253824 RepID=A0A6J4M2V5_9ACTN|nr:MAG: Cysteine desulfurase [uncultured Nocardioidaceae bacterium]
MESRSQPAREVYLDHAATTPMLPEAVAAMLEEQRRVGNASSLHGAGRASRRVVEESRERIAQALGARPAEVVFTSGGTEADNLAVTGIVRRRGEEDSRRVRVLATAVEHPAVLEPLARLAQHEGVQVELVPVDETGRVDVGALQASVERDPGSVALVSLMWANNEVGTVQPVDEAVAVAAPHGIPVHSDAVQAVGAVPVDVATSGVDALSVAAHKHGGPYGVGALVVRRGLEPRPLVHGGGQERGIRSGTVNRPAIAGFAVAVEHAVKHQAETHERLAALRDDLVARVRAEVPDVRLNGHPVHRLPGNAHLGFPGCEGDALLMLLDREGIACSTGSACSAGVPQASHVLLAMGRGVEEARGSLRFTLGRTSTAADVDAVVDVIGAAVARARAAAR